VSVEYPDLADYLAIAAAVTGVDLKTLLNATKLDLADSALHAPSARPVPTVLTSAQGPATGQASNALPS
jgi:hypothetical protein